MFSGSCELSLRDLPDVFRDLPDDLRILPGVFRDLPGVFKGLASSPMSPFGLCLHCGTDFIHIGGLQRHTTPT